MFPEAIVLEDNAIEAIGDDITKNPRVLPVLLVDVIVLEVIRVLFILPPKEL